MSRRSITEHSIEVGQRRFAAVTFATSEPHTYRLAEIWLVETSRIGRRNQNRLSCQSSKVKRRLSMPHWILRLHLACIPIILLWEQMVNILAAIAFLFNLLLSLMWELIMILIRADLVYLFLKKRSRSRFLIQIIIFLSVAAQAIWHLLIKNVADLWHGVGLLFRGKDDRHLVYIALWTRSFLYIRYDDLVIDELVCAVLDYVVSCLLAPHWVMLIRLVVQRSPTRPEGSPLLRIR